MQIQAVLTQEKPERHRGDSRQPRFRKGPLLTAGSHQKIPTFQLVALCCK
jgi:hypothetical protein